MAEGVAVAGGQVRAGVYDNPEAPPALDRDAAPHGWVWRAGAWSPAARAPKPGTSRAAWLAAATAEPAPAGSARPDADDTGQAPGPARSVREDPAPGWAGASTSSTSSSTTARPASSTDDSIEWDDVPEDVKDDVAGLAGLVATPILAMLRRVDPYCGTVLADNLEPVVDATLPLILRSRRIVDYFAGDKADWIKWGKLAMALAPVGEAIVAHHILRTVEVVRDPGTGAVEVRPTRKGAGAGDPLQPHVQPEPAPAYSYAA